MKKLIFVFTTVFAIAFANTLNAQNGKTKDIVDIAVSVDDFSTLVTALKAANLVDALKGEGPFTVFAPTNSAFAKIDSKTLNALLEPKNRETLSKILTYHVISGKYEANDVVKALKKGGGAIVLKTLSGDKVKIKQRNGGIYLKDQKGNYSKIVKTDVIGTNGVIHIIDTVVMPN